MNEKILTVLRGLPGSGKSTMAQYLCERLPRGEAAIVSTDDYFMADGHYLFDFSELAKAHLWNQQRCSKLMQRGVSTIIADNTNTQLWEMREYVKLATANGYKVMFSETSHLDPEVLAKRTVHGVPAENIRKMLSRWESLPADAAEAVAAVTDARAPWERV